MARFSTATNILGVSTFSQPPNDFLPETASDAELEEYGFPARPNTNQPFLDYATWLRIVKCNRIVPLLEKTKVYHAPARGRGQTTMRGGVMSTTSYNWSGIVIEDTNNPFAAAQTRVAASYVHPTVINKDIGFPPLILAIVPDAIVSQWVGVDGWNTNSNDVLQCGTSAHLYVPVGGSDNYFWIEWYPDPEVRVTNLPVRTGDLVSIFLSVVGPTKGSFVLANLTTNQSVPLWMRCTLGNQTTGRFNRMDCRAA